MAIIETVQPNVASGEVGEIYDSFLKMRGRIGNNAILFSSSPAALRMQYEFINYYSSHPTLSQPLLTAIRVLVSQSKECEFCIDMNSGFLINRFGWSVEDVEVMKKDASTTPLQAKEQAMLEFVIKGMEDSLGVNESDIVSLRDLGWSDGDILDALYHGARMSGTDIMFNALKIEKDF